ncbi:GTP-binding protein [Leucobacter sp. CSA1]|uniref:GTP-binding protein n=1 Tax=Leucobacter chromiisoli TaxID=2796471 RepID=A0A934UV72_9MICO|nr:GTP-binding protein [Leucobacter chromiisoli]MBK0419600.1 GTP-binding protein [Leucobacter chromiisoli]
MDLIDVTAVIGSCSPERLGAARRLAQQTGSMVIPASRLAISPAPLDEAASLVPWAYTEGRAVVEFPAGVPVTHIIGMLADAEEGTRLVDVTCVVDACHLLDDLQREDYLVRRGPLGVEGRSRALITAEQIEFASTVLLVNWEPLSTPELSTTMSLINHLGPSARLRLHRSGPESPPSRTIYSAGQERPGWIGILNEDFSPHMTDPRVGAFRYENLRPMHPERLSRLLDDRVARGAFGTVVRSAGFCRLATRPGITGQWEHVGQMFSLHPLANDADAWAGDEDDEVLAVGQDIAFIGLDLDRPALVTALDEATLTDEEFAAGPSAWASYPDPFPVSQTAIDRAE